MPDHINLTSEGFFDDKFVRYDMDFRNGIRLYQQDLEAGRYDPDWLRQAAQAMDRRANGDFDKWKEQEYEEFWGQKQRLDTKARAGQSGIIKLNRLIEAGLFKEGDVFSYKRTFGRGKGKLTVEKDVKVIQPLSTWYCDCHLTLLKQIVEIDGTTMTFAIPPAQLKYARRLAPNQDEDQMIKNGKTGNTPAGGKHSESHEAGRNDTEDIRAKIDNADDTEVKDNTAEFMKVMNNTVDDIKVMDNNAEDVRAKIHNADDTEVKNIATEDIKLLDNIAGYSNLENDNTQAQPSDPGNVESKNTTPRPGDAEAPSMASPSPAPSSQLSAIPSDVDDVVLASITTLQALEDKIVTIDGRLGKKVDGNAFKSIRVKRNNQDLGTLFEIREEWYVYKK